MSSSLKEIIFCRRKHPKLDESTTPVDHGPSVHPTYGQDMLTKSASNDEKYLLSVSFM